RRFLGDRELHRVRRHPSLRSAELRTGCRLRGAARRRRGVPGGSRATRSARSKRRLRGRVGPRTRRARLLRVSRPRVLHVDGSRSFGPGRAADALPRRPRAPADPALRPTLPYGIAPPGFRLPAATRLGRVVLQIADLDRSLGYYHHVLGLRVLDQAPGRAVLGPPGDDTAIVELRELRGA